MAIAELSTIVTGIKGTIDIAKGLKSAYDAHTITQAQTEILEKLFSLQIDALSLQEKHSALVNEKEELAKKLMEFEQWEKTESQYQLEEVHFGVFVYSPKESERSTEPKHWLCTNCWEERKKSILQCDYKHSEGAGYTCPRCKTQIQMRFPHPPSDPIVHTRNPFDAL